MKNKTEKNPRRIYHETFFVSIGKIQIQSDFLPTRCNVIWCRVLSSRFVFIMNHKTSSLHIKFFPTFRNYIYKFVNSLILIRKINMTWLNSAALLLVFLVTVVIIHRLSDAESNVNLGKFSSPLQKIPWSIDVNEPASKSLQNNIFENKKWSYHQLNVSDDELNCTDQWLKFGYSCYFLSDYVMTIAQASQTCIRFPWQNSRLMYIKHPMELFYAAHMLIKNKLPSLLFEIDQDLMRGQLMQMNLSSMIAFLFRWKNREDISSDRSCTMERIDENSSSKDPCRIDHDFNWKADRSIG